MILSDIIKSNSWLSVKLTLEKLFPDQNELWDDYEKVFNELQTLQPVESNVTIDVELAHDTYDNTDYVDVSGYYTNPADRTEEYTNSLAIEFVPWNEWLGMSIDKKSLDNFSELEIIAHCLNEMTYSGFEQEEIQEEFNRIKAVKEEYDSMNPEEKAKRTYSIDEVKKMLETNDEELDVNANDENE